MFIGVVGDFHLTANGSGRNGIDEVVTVLDRSAINGGDYIAALETGFFSGTSGLNGFNHNTVGCAKRL
jgi:hypothetical protein